MAPSESDNSNLTGFMRLVTGVLLSLVLMQPLKAFATEETIRVGGNSGYPPYEFLDKNGAPTGFTVELLQTIADVMGMKVEITVGEWAKMHDALIDGSIDMTLGMSYSEKREKVFDFASPHTVVQHAIFARRDMPPVSSLAELKDKKVIVHRSGIMHERLKALGYGKDLVLTETPADGLRLLASGEQDYAVVALLPGMYIIREYKLSNLVPVAKNVASFPFSFAVREGNTELLARLNEGLTILKKTGQYQTIYDKWLGVLEPARVSWEKVLQYGAMTLLPLLLLLTGTVIWSRTLQRKVAQRTEELAQQVAEKELALEELRLQQDKLIQADKMTSLGILVSGVAHEINNPNGLILLNVPTLKEASADAETILEEYYHAHGDFTYGGLPYSRMKDKIPRLFTEMHEGAKRIKRIVDDLKDFARQDTSATMEPLDLNAVVQAAVRLVEPSLRNATRQFTATYDDSLPPVRGNVQRIEQVIVNLLLNACQALPDNGRKIALSTCYNQASHTVQLAVSDEGIGISPEVMPFLTDPFFTTKRDAGGTGLGLSVSAGIVKEHGGSLDFTSVPGEGTIVTLILPAEQKEQSMTESLYPNFNILLVDDEPAWLLSLSITLERCAGITNVTTCEDSRDVMGILGAREIGIVLLDLTMPGPSGEELLARITEEHPGVIVIIISGMNQLETAVRCIQNGAFDYFVKTAEEDRIVSGVLRAVRMLELQRENQEMSKRLLSGTLQHPKAFVDIITADHAMHAIFSYIEAVAKSSEPLLISGESGVGKEFIAKAAHNLSGCRGALVAVNVAGLDDTVFADTLFGHVRGAFTGADQARRGMIEEAADGTLFLDEIGDLSIASQVKLLRLLQEGEYFPLGSDRPKRLKARVIFATHQDLAAKQTAGTFRRDLYFRLCTHHVQVPPLRERKGDIPLLLDHFLGEASRALHKKKPTPPKELAQLLATYSFPGNVREMKAMIYNAVSIHTERILSMESFVKIIGQPKGDTTHPDATFNRAMLAGLNQLPTFGEAAEVLVDEALARANGNQTIAARLLGITQSALSKRLKMARQPETM